MSQPKMCSQCKHYITGGEPFRCKAYPDQKIPAAIMEGKHDHREAYAGDNGVRFVPHEDVAFMWQD